jgi:hypothetical protein
MSLVDSGWQVIGCALVFVIGLAIAMSLAKSFGVRRSRATLIYVWHTLFCFVNAIYVIENGGDGLGYYSNALSGTVSFEFGTQAIVAIAIPFANFAGLSFLGVNLVFNIFGFIGLLAFYGSLRAELVNRPIWVRRIALGIVLLPSISFWSSGLGKDALAFLSAGLALWSALNLGSRTLLMALSIVVMLIVRPHIASIMVLGLVGSYLLTRGISLWRRAFVFSIGLWGAIVVVPFALNYAGVAGDQGVDDFSRYIERREISNIDGGGGVDLASMNPVMRILTYLFRPLPFEAHNISALAASMDNVFLVILFVMGGWGLIHHRQRYLPANTTFMWLYAGGSLVALAMTTANLGISVRQKWMFLPMLIYLLLSVTGRTRDPNRPSSLRPVAW